MMDYGAMLVYLEQLPEPEVLGIPCPLCEIEAGVWCKVILAIDGTRIGLVHKERMTYLTGD